MGTRRIGNAVDVLRHHELLQINDRVAQLCRTEQLIERVAPHPAALCRKMEVGLRVLRTAADM